MTLAIGDVQGCFSGLRDVLALAGVPLEAPRDAQHGGHSGDAGAERLWLTGDLVNRGPDSLETLRWAMRQGDRLVTVLGNHDLNLLAIAAGVRRPHRSDTIDDVLAAPDRAPLLDWLRRRPLAHFEHRHLLVHAGVLPQWDAARVLALAREVQAALAGEGWREFLRDMYGDEPSRWDDGLGGIDRLRVVVNALTRLRFCTADGQMEFRTKEGTGAAPAGYLPWFDVPARATRDVTLVVGHWSTLGLVVRDDLLALDTGCVWGGELSAVRLEDRAVFRAPCPRAATPGLR